MVLKPTNFNRRHIGRTHRVRSVVLFGCTKRKGKGEKDRESSSSDEESPGEESPVKDIIKGISFVFILRSVRDIREKIASNSL